jgi:hypothetical protein
MKMALVDTILEAHPKLILMLKSDIMKDNKDALPDQQRLSMGLYTGKSSIAQSIARKDLWFEYQRLY